MDYRHKDLQGKLNDVAEALHIVHTMAHMIGDQGYDALISTADGLQIWEGLCEDIMRFLNEAPLIVGAAIINLISRESKISFTRIIPHVSDEHNLTIQRLRSYIRHAMLIEMRVEADIEKAREKAEAAGAPLVGEVEKALRGEPA